MNDLETTTQGVDLPSGYSDANTSLAVSLARAEVDQQIATARALPRQLSTVVKRIETLATMDDESAEECVYALPRGGKPIKGPSIRLAEIIGSQWGNARVGARVVHVDRVEKFVEAEGVFHDLETNMATTARVRRRISDRKGALLTDDMIIVTGNAACSIAKRNAILGGVPKAVWRKAYAAVESVIAGDVKTLVERREKAMKAFAAFGAKPEQVVASLGLAGVEDITIEHMTTLMGMHSALKNGEATVEEMFSPQSAERSASGLRERLEASKPSEQGFSADHISRETVQSIDRETGEVRQEFQTKSGLAPNPTPTQDLAPQPDTSEEPTQSGTDAGAGSSAPASSSPVLEISEDGQIISDNNGNLLASALRRAEQGMHALERFMGSISVDEEKLLRSGPYAVLAKIADRVDNDFPGDR